jgi:hypothetical protein
MKATFPILATAAALFFSSCASTGGSTSATGASTAKKSGSKPANEPDHEPKIDFWQNGGGACCPYHAQAYQAEALAAKKSKKS